ncbi:MAG: thiazole synthase [Deltaproteobacteria bacterium]|nr:thiazole synthase [Deltaproteobacteria bacterium]
MVDKPLVIANREFRSRLMIGTGKFASSELLKSALQSSGAEIVTVAIRRVDISNKEEPILKAIDRGRYFLLPNTSGARDAKEALKVAQIAREILETDWIKLEVTPDPRSLLPDPVETYLAAKMMIEDGFVVLPYMPADPILAKRLEDLGCATVMPLGSPIGSNRGIRTEDAIRMIIENSSVPVVVDAGIGAPSHAAYAMEMGADAVLVNTCIATAKDPVLMAEAIRDAVIAGRKAFIAGIPPQSIYARPSSPLKGQIF